MKSIPTGKWCNLFMLFTGGAALDKHWSSKHVFLPLVYYLSLYYLSLMPKYFKASRLFSIAVAFGDGNPRYQLPVMRTRAV